MAAGQRVVSVDTRVDGLKEAIAGLKNTPERLDKGVRSRFREIAADVRDKARAAAAGQHPAGGLPRNSPQHWEDLVKSIKSGAESSTPTVSIGSGTVPWALGFEFGSKGGPGTSQFPPWRGNQSGAGYFFWPTIRKEHERAVEASLEIINDALKEAYPD